MPLALVLLAAAQSSEPLIGGAVEPGDPAIVSIAGRCTGVLIGARTVLTAAHCAADTLEVRFEQGTREVVSQHPHPLWVRGVPRHDVMLLELKETVPGLQPLALYPRPLSDAELGRELRVVAYGVAQAGDPSGLGVKRAAVMALDRLTPFQLEATGDGVQACDGDSGGPGLMLLGDVEYVAATVSAGNRTCDSTNFFTRIDVESSWISTTAAAWGDSIASCAKCGGTEPAEGCSSTGGGLTLLALAALVRLLQLNVSPSARLER